MYKSLKEYLEKKHNNKYDITKYIDLETLPWKFAIVYYLYSLIDHFRITEKFENNKKALNEKINQ